MNYFDEFDDKRAVVLGQAFDLTIQKLRRFGDLDINQREMIANRLISLGRQGVNNIEALSEAALEYFRRRR